MGICDSFEKSSKYLNSPSIYHQQLQQIPFNYSFKFDSSKIKNNFNKSYHLKYTFSDFKIKYCISHKPDRNSFYIIEIKIGDKSFPLVLSSGQSPNIPNLQGNNSYSLEQVFKFEELENTYFSIDIYELLESIPNVTMSMKTIPAELKVKAQYYSFFRINLSSFLFKSCKCDFPLMGSSQLSTKTRIAFNCFIEQKEPIKIDAAPLKNPNIQRLVFEYKDKLITTQTRQNNFFTITTPPLSMQEFQNSNIFLETVENDNYSYISLNKLKYNIIKNLSMKISSMSDLNKLEMHAPLDMNTTLVNNSFEDSDSNSRNSNIYMTNQTQTQEQNIFGNFGQGQTDEAILYLSNLPFIAQLNNLYFTEYGNLFNTSILNIINDDEELHKFRKGKQISSDDFREKLNRYYTEFNKPDKNFAITKDIQILLMRSIDTDKFMFIYPNNESLFAMVNLMLSLGISIISNILNSTDEFNTLTLLKMINILLKREELDNSVLYFYFSNYKNEDKTHIQLYNQFYLFLFELYKFLLLNKVQEGNDEILIELYSKLYFKKRYLRKLMLSTLSGKDYIFKQLSSETLLYDEINDEKLNKYLSENVKESINQFCKNSANINNFQFDIYRLFKRIISILKDSNIMVYPLDYSLFYDNVYIIGAIQNEIYAHKYENNNINNNKQSLSNDFYETLMFFSNSYSAISTVNNSLIQSTNAHDQYAIYTLFIYFKSLFDYHSSITDSKPIFDYSSLELASEILAKDADSVSLPRLFWFYYSCHDSILSGNLKWFIIHIVNKNFDRFAYHWSFTIRQVYFKLIIFVLTDKIKNKEGQFFNKQKINPFLNKSLNIKQSPYIYEANKDFDIIRREFNVWVDRRAKNPNSEFPVFNLPLPMVITSNID